MPGRTAAPTPDIITGRYPKYTSKSDFPLHNKVFYRKYWARIRNNVNGGQLTTKY